MVKAQATPVRNLESAKEEKLFDSPIITIERDSPTPERIVNCFSLLGNLSDIVPARRLTVLNNIVK